MRERALWLASAWLLAGCTAPAPDLSERIGIAQQYLSGPPTADWSQFPDGAQCAVGVQGFYKNRYGVGLPALCQFPDHGGCASCGACENWVGTTLDPNVWLKIPWGQTTPQAYDMIVFPPIGGDPYGHVAAVDHTDGNGTVWIMDDNWNLDERKASCTFNNHVCGDPHTWNQGGWQPYGVYRLKQLAGPPPPPPDKPPIGSLDAASCDSIGGWTQDPDTPDQSMHVHVYLGGDSNSGAPMLDLAADQSRADLCKAIGSCNHAFNVGLPRALKDGKAHDVHVYGTDSGAGPTTELPGSPKSVNCAPPQAPFAPAVKRHIASPDVLGAWKFSTLWDLAHLSDGDVGALPTAADLPSAPKVVQADDGTPEVWVVDGNMRRHVVDGDSMNAWRFGAPEKTPAAQVYALALGPDLPHAPFLVQGSDPAVYVLDAPLGDDGPPPSDSASDPGSDPGPSGDGPLGSPPIASNGADGSNASASGSCALSAAPKRASPGAWWAWLAASAAVATRRRRRRAGR